MSLMVARKKRAALYLSICGLLAMVAAVSAVSARDPSGATLRIGMIMVTLGAAMWLNWRFVLPVAIGVWLGTNLVRTLADGTALFGTDMLLELPGMVGVAAFAALARHSLKTLEDENILLGATSDEHSGVDPETGVYEERLLRPAIETEVARARRFRREFAIVLVGIDAMRQRFDYRDEETWDASFVSTSRLLRGTRNNIDRAYRYGATSFALVLPESTQRDVTGLVRRLRRVARHSQPAEGDPGGPLPTHFGATFYPQCATSTEDLLRRAEIALRIAEKNSSRMQLDSAEAPEMASPETMRRAEEEVRQQELKQQQGTEVSVVLADEGASPIEAMQAARLVRPDLVVPIPLHGSPASMLDDANYDEEDEDRLDADYDDIEEIEPETAPVYASSIEDSAAVEDRTDEPQAVWQDLQAGAASAEAFALADAFGEDVDAVEETQPVLEQPTVGVYAYAETDEAPQTLWDALSPDERAAFEAAAAESLALNEPPVETGDVEAGVLEPEWSQPAAFETMASEPEAIEPVALESIAIAAEEAEEPEVTFEPETEPGPEVELEPVWLPEPIAWPYRSVEDEEPSIPEPVVAFEASWPADEMLEPEAPRSVPYLRAVTDEDLEAPAAAPQEETLEELLKRMDQTLDLLKTLKSGTGS